MNVDERALTFRCGDAELYGIASIPEQAFRRGVLIVVGGPQYRAGSHRQFTLLARHLAARGIPVMRFDYRGMGDSEGKPRTFEDVTEDIQHSIDHFFTQVPPLKEVVIWGLCDAASAALFYGHRDHRVSGLVLLNPWARTVAGEAATRLKHYYAHRLFDRELWKKIVRGGFEYRAAIRSIRQAVAAVAAARLRRSVTTNSVSTKLLPLPERMLEGLHRFKGKVLLITSGNDLTAKEFLDMVAGSHKWKRLLASPNVERRELPEANHTFSRRDWRDQVATWTGDWARSW